MKIFDMHCDVLYKLFENPVLEFGTSQELQVNIKRLVSSGTKVQFFAIYVSESVHPDLKFQAALRMVDLFYEKVLKPYPNIKHLKSMQELASLAEDEIGVVLTLEGCEAIGQDLLKLKTLLRLGVRAVGLTWNYRNYVADGALEEKGAGLSRFGKQVIQVLSETGTACDSAHLSERGFWDVMESGVHTFNSHSNCHSLCPHPRNLRDEQIKALIKADSVMGITFVPQFLTVANETRIADILRHVEHVCSLGGENHLGFGSDFDGILSTVQNLAGNDQYNNLVGELQKHYSELQVKKFLYDNVAARLMF